MEWALCAVSSPHLIFKHLVSSVVGLSQLVSPSMALPAELVLIRVSILNLLEDESYENVVGLENIDDLDQLRE